MNDHDIKEVISTLKKALKNEDWELVVEAIEYLNEYNSDDSSDDDLGD